jgi:hypothetical protein
MSDQGAESLRQKGIHIIKPIGRTESVWFFFYMLKVDPLLFGPLQGYERTIINYCNITFKKNCLEKVYFYQRCGTVTIFYGSGSGSDF